MKYTKMKISNTLSRSVSLASIALATLGLLVPNPILAQGKGSSKLMASAAAPVQSQTTTSKTCARCTDRFAKVADNSGKGMRAEPLKTIAVHGCPACATTITSAGAGKTRTDKVNHSCGMQGTCCMASK
ncbi:MAG TPA: hypothetical protein VFE51_29655 [Verrucomicrobiae bacterium]|nr:hypothetical protein [Verrucomicrobiae bacterium]